MNIFTPSFAVRHVFAAMGIAIVAMVGWAQTRPAATGPASRPATGPAPTTRPATGPASRPATRPATQPAPTAKPTPRTTPAPKPTPPPAEPPAPHVSYIFPAGGQQGKSVELTIGGAGILNATGISVNGQGVTPRIPASQPADAKILKVSMDIAAGATPGVRDLRVLTPGGVSNRMRFVVGTVPEVNEIEPNQEIATAQTLPAIPVVVNGQLMGGDADTLKRVANSPYDPHGSLQGGDKDTFRFSAKAGQTLVLEVQAQALVPFIADAVPGWIQAAMTLYDASGKQLAYVDDFQFHPDPLMVFKVPADGDYYVEIKDTIFRGREDFVYRLSIGTGPAMTNIYPLGAKRGASAKFELYGANLPQKDVTLSIPPEGTAKRLLSMGHDGKLTLLPDVSVYSGSGANLVPLEAGDLDEAFEAEPNDTQAAATRINTSTNVNGRIDKPGDVDWFVFSAKAKESLVIDLRARRLGSPLDSIVTIYDAAGKQLAQNDDWVDDAEGLLTHHADSHLAFTFPASGDYYVKVADTQGKGGPEYGYRLTIAPPRKDFGLRIAPDSVRMAPGDTAVLTAGVVRRDGLDDEVQLSVKGLPAGYVVRGAVIPAKEKEARFTITAPADAKAGDIIRPTIIGRAKFLTGTTRPADDTERTIVHEAQTVEQVMQAFAWTFFVPTEGMLVSVCPPNCFTMSVDLPAGGVLEVPQGGETQVTVKVQRGKDAQDKDITGNIGLSVAQPAPKGFSAKYVAIAPDKSDAAVTITAAKQVPVGLTQYVILTGTLRQGKDTVVRYTPAIPVKILPPVATQPTTASQPATATAPARTTAPATASAPAK